MIEKLHNNEHVLLMYLADELPVEDRLEVDRMLATDASLRAELEQLRSIQQTFETALAGLDEMSGIPASAEASARRVGREIRSRLARPPAAGSQRERERRGWPMRWVYPFAAAAAVALAIGIWATHRSPHPDDSPPDLVFNQPDPPQPDNDVLFASLDEDDSDLQAVAMSTPSNSDLTPKDELSDLMLDEQPIN